MKIICIVGPTGVGKTKLSIELAKIYNGEIINADSTQIYKELDIATAKIKDKENIIHHLIDIKAINEDYTVFDYQKDARKCIEEIIEKNKTPIIVGGTGLYIKACLFDYKFNQEIKTNNYDDLTNEQLYNELIKIDPKTEIHINNRNRVIRALDYYKQNNQPISEKEKTDNLLYDTIFIGLTTNRELLYEKINNRVEEMFNEGLLEEALYIYKKNIKSKAVMTPIGYKELFDYFENKISLDEAKELIKQRSRKYAKRQYTWFNHQIKTNWFEVDYNNFNNTVEEINQFIGGILWHHI